MMTAFQLSEKIHKEKIFHLLDNTLSLFHIYNFGTDRIQKMLTNINGSKNLGSIFGTAKSNTVLPRHSATRESYHDLHNAMAL